MAPRPPAQRPDWLVVGADVLVWTGTPGGTSASKDTVATVGNQFFTLTGEPGRRYNISTLSWSAGAYAETYRVVAADSDEGRAVTRSHNTTMAQRRAAKAVAEWRDHPRDGVAIADAIAQLTKFRDRLADETAKAPKSWLAQE